MSSSRSVAKSNDLTDTPTVSIVVPLYNEQGNVSALSERLDAVVKSIAESSEVIFVDDGSRDDTWSRILTETAARPAFRGLRLSRNFGHQSALLAGLCHARGQAIVSLDGDLQHPPELIPKLLEAWRAGNEIVATKRLDRQVASPFKRMSSRLYYKIFTALSGVPIHEGSSDFRLLDRKVLDQIISVPGHIVFLRGMVEWVGFSRTSINFHAEPRYSGTTKYTFRKMIRFALTGIVGFSTKPLVVAIWIGLATSLLSFAYMIYALFMFLNGSAVPGWSSTVGILSFLFGVLFVLIGIIGLYLARVHQALLAWPNFIVSQNTSSANFGRMFGRAEKPSL